jgi:flagellar M-ring protein FliF
MALVNTATLSAQAKGFNGLPILRQIGLMIGLAASVALGVAIVLWSQTPGYSLLYGKLSDAEAAQVSESLERAGIAYKFEHASGAITVPSSRVHEARLKLATEGLPKSEVTGFELLDGKQGFGTSRFMEQARYHRALEGELARSIATLQSVESARVHLAIPKRSVFVRGKSKPRASVVLNLYAGNRLDGTRLAGIMHLVAASVPELEADQVTIVDQKGRLLTESQGSEDISLSANQLAYTRRLEELYVKRIGDILTPILGAEGFRAQVVAKVDFTMEERTTESYTPENMAVRSEETIEEKTAAAGPMGVPGALSNQPPGAGTTDARAQDGGNSAAPVNSSRRATRNYELDRSISHTRFAPGSIERLSVAVVADHRSQVGENGKSERVPLNSEELERITALVKEAVGFDEQRNDSVNVSNVSFQPVEEAGPMPAAPAIWQQPWVWDVAKQALGVLLVLFLALGILRPVLSSLASRSEMGTAALHGGAVAGQLPLTEDQLQLSGQLPGMQVPIEQQFGAAKSMIEDDPRRVAQVMKTWVAADG